MSTDSCSIVGGQIVDGHGAAPIRRGSLHVRDGLVAAAVEQPGDEQEPAEATGFPEFDATGCTVLPGLIDTHVHALTIARMRGYTDVEAAAWGTANLSSAVAFGVTTMRDMGTHYGAIFALRRGVEEHWYPGPRLLAAGSAIAMTGGHHHDALSVEADGPYGVITAVRRQIKAGADVVKFMASGGAGTKGQTPYTAQLRPEELRAGIEVAHDAGRRTAAHAHSTQGIKNAVLAGVDSIEHGVLCDDEAIELMLERNVTLTPTLSVYRRIVDSEGTSDAAPPYMIEASRQILDAHTQSFRRCLEAGVRLCLGTDSGGGFHPLGVAASLELEMWVENGMTPMGAIESATRIAAENCGIDDAVGTLSPGKRADVLVVEGDALTDITALRRVRYVFRDGQLLFDGTGDS